MKPQFIIGSTTSGGGKTTLLLGLLRVLARKGMKVQPFKCGPDFTDIPYHSDPKHVQQASGHLILSDTE